MSAFTPISWPTKSQVTLSRVPWDSNYRDVVRFADEATREAYFESIADTSIVIKDMTYLKPTEPILINTPFSAAYNYNYCVVKNPELPVPGEVTPPVLFYFVTSVAFVAANTTAITLQLDVFQTYLFDIEFGNCFVERGHAAVQATQNTNDPKVMARYLTAAEGLDIGSEYTVMSHEYRNMTGNFDGDPKGYYIMITSTTDLTGNLGTKENPALTTAKGQQVDGLIGGCNVYMLLATNFIHLMNALSDYPWVTKGIISIVAFPSSIMSMVEADEVTIQSYPAYKLGRTLDDMIIHTSKDIFNELGLGLTSRYAKLRKFYTYPYSVIELTSYNGSPVLLKPELLDTKHIELRVLSQATPPHTRIGIYPQNYGRGSSTYLPKSEPNPHYDMYNYHSGAELLAGLNTDVAVWIADMPTFSVVNDEYISYMASTTHGRAYSYSSAGWSAERSNAQATNSYDNAMNGLAVNQENKDIQNVATAATAGVNLLGAIGTNPGAAVASSINTGIELVAGNMQFQNTQQYQAGVESANYNLAQWANRGDYQNQIAGINATVQDAALTQPSVAGQAGGSGFNLANGLMGVEIRYKQCDYNHVCIIGNYWHRYGYAIQQFLKPPKSLQCMDKFTYWKMAETYLTVASADEGARNAIRGIFEKGVTVWATPELIGAIDISTNNPLPGAIY